MYIARIRTQILEHKLGQQLQRFGKDTDLRFHGVPRHSCDKICILDLHFFTLDLQLVSLISIGTLDIRVVSFISIWFTHFHFVS